MSRLNTDFKFLCLFSVGLILSMLEHSTISDNALVFLDVLKRPRIKDNLWNANFFLSNDSWKCFRAFSYAFVLCGMLDMRINVFIGLAVENEVNSTSQQLVELLVAAVTDLFSVRLYQSLPSLWRNLWPTLLCFCISVYFDFVRSFFKLPPQHFSQVNIWTFTEPLQYLDFFLAIRF